MRSSWLQKKAEAQGPIRLKPLSPLILGITFHDLPLTPRNLGSLRSRALEDKMYSKFEPMKNDLLLRAARGLFWCINWILR